MSFADWDDEPDTPGAQRIRQRDPGAAGPDAYYRTAPRLRRRPLHLIMGICAVAAGLCLVTGLTAVAAGAGQRGLTVHSPSAGWRRGPGGSSGVRIRYQAGRVVAVLDGAGSAQTRPFAIPGPGTWGLAWSFGCARTGHPGMFTVGESGTPAARAVALDAAGWSARGTAWMTGDAGRHVLVVISDCVWTIRILRPGGPR